MDAFIHNLLANAMSKCAFRSELAVRLWN